jgi:hypothetical protein
VARLISGPWRRLAEIEDDLGIAVTALNGEGDVLTAVNVQREHGSPALRRNSSFVPGTVLTGALITAASAGR